MLSPVTDSSVVKQISDIFDRWYDLGKLLGLRQITGGYCNTSYSVRAEKKGRHTRYLLRQYNPNIAEKELHFEHALIRHLRYNGFTLVADVIGCRSGETFVRLLDVDRDRPTYWGLFEFLGGEDKYSWTWTDLSDEEFAHSAEILARLHHAGRDFKPPAEAERVQPPIMEFLATLPAVFNGYSRQTRNRSGDRVFTDNLKTILSAIQRCVAIKNRLTGLLQLPIHCDYHPGNLKFQDCKVVGIFDFDWSKIDYRIFDVALALVYFVSVWPGKAGGSLRLDKFELFLETYNSTCRQLRGIPGLSPAEAHFLLPMLSAANLYVLNWDLMDYYMQLNPDDDEYFNYIDHNVRLMHWIDKHHQNLQAAIRRACG